MATQTIQSAMRKSTPIVTECFRNATLYQAAPLSEVRQNIANRRQQVLNNRASSLRYNSFYNIDSEGQQYKPQRESLPQDDFSIEEELSQRQKRLTILFSWLGAKEKYAMKYIDLWTQRGHSVMYVTSSVRDLLQPKTGAEVTAEKIKEHIAGLDQWKVIVHGLSVGGYITQHVLKVNDSNITSKISHQIYDSFTNVEGLANGVENAVSPRFSKIARRVGEFYLKYADLSSFNESRNHILNGKAHSPVFFMHSLADNVARYDVTEPLVKALQSKCPVDTFLIPKEEKVPHVALLRHMGPPAYMDMVETFLENHKEVNK